MQHTSTTASLRIILARYQQPAPQACDQAKLTPVSSYRSNGYRIIRPIEATSSRFDCSHRAVTSFNDLWEQITDLVSNKCFVNKFKYLYRAGYGGELLELAEVARTKQKPAHWFATSTKLELDESTGRKRLSERALDFIRRLREIARQADVIRERLGIPARKLALKTAWRLRGRANIEALAADAITYGRDPRRLFWHLYSEALAGRLYRPTPVTH